MSGVRSVAVFMNLTSLTITEQIWTNLRPPLTKKSSPVKEEKRRKEEHLREIEQETASNEYKKRIERAYYELELQSTAHELDEWCEECGCIHESDIVNDHWTNLNQFDTSHNNQVKEEKPRKEERLREIEQETASNEYKERIERAY